MSIAPPWIRHWGCCTSCASSRRRSGRVFCLYVTYCHDTLWQGAVETLPSSPMSNRTKNSCRLSIQFAGEHIPSSPCLQIQGTPASKPCQVLSLEVQHNSYTGTKNYKTPPPRSKQGVGSFRVVPLLDQGNPNRTGGVKHRAHCTQESFG